MVESCLIMRREFHIHLTLMDSSTVKVDGSRMLKFHTERTLIEENWFSVSRWNFFFIWQLQTWFYFHFPQCNLGLIPGILMELHCCKPAWDSMTFQKQNAFHVQYLLHRVFFWAHELSAQLTISGLSVCEESKTSEGARRLGETLLKITETNLSQRLFPYMIWYNAKWLEKASHYGLGPTLPLMVTMPLTLVGPGAGLM